jgi:hypothetical protein
LKRRVNEPAALPRIRTAGPEKVHVPRLTGKGCFTLGCCCAMLSSAAGASGEFQVRYYSVGADQTLLDAFSVQLKLLSPASADSSYAVDLSAETPLQSLTGRYTSGRHSFQVQARRQVDAVGDSSNLSGNLNYFYSPVLEPSGLALSSFSAFYAYSGSQSPTQATDVHTAGLNFGVRFSDNLSASLSGSGTLVNIQAGTFTSNQQSASASGSLNYRDANTSASISPSVTLANGVLGWNIGLSARTALNDDLAFSGYANLNSSSVPTTTAEVEYDASALLGDGTPRGKLKLGAAVTFTDPVLTLAGRVRTALSPDLNLGASVGYTPSTAAVTYTADASGRLGSVYLNANASLSTVPDTAASFSVGASLSSQADPLYGSLSVGYQQQSTYQSGYASGSFGYRSGGLQVGTTLALTATAQSGGALGLVGSGIVGGTAFGGWQIIGTADLTAAYAIFDNIDVSASVRYEQESSASPAHLRYGAGLRYRF